METALRHLPALTVSFFSNHTFPTTMENWRLQVNCLLRLRLFVDAKKCLQMKLWGLQHRLAAVCLSLNLFYFIEID